MKKANLPGSFIAVSKLNPGSANVTRPFPLLFGICNGAMQSWNSVFLYEDRLVRTNPHWIRDYMLTVKAFRFMEKDITSFPDILLDHQHESGFFYEILSAESDIHSGRKEIAQKPGSYLVEEPYRMYEPGSRFGFCRLELEADIEYLMVEGCYLIWQSTGDDEWLKKQLPRLERGLQYMMTSPVRWDKKYELVKRPHTLDTWDFTDRAFSSFDRMIRPEDPMGIFHGDNTGLFYGLILLAKMFRYFGDEAKAAQYESCAAKLRERIMKNLWNGKFFRHFLMLDPADYGVDETWQLSLSNAYALNRGILTLAQKKSILAAYRACREKYKGTLDDFRNLEPPYPNFHNLKPGDYMDGGNAPFVAGQLAVAAFECGEEEYGADILTRMGCKFLRDGKVSFLYNWDEKDMVGGPRCWSGAEIMNGMTTGLAGVVDNGKLFEDVVISPRFAATDEDHVYVRLEYAASGAACEYEWQMGPDCKSMDFNLYSRHKSCKLRLYVPKGTTPVSAERNGKAADFTIEDVAGSKYAVLPLSADDQVHLEFQ